MTPTQKHALVLKSLGYISTNVEYSTAELFGIYMQHQAQVDTIFANQSQLQSTLQANMVYLPQIIIMDPDAIWGA